MGEQSNSGRVIAIIIILVLVAAGMAGAWYWLVYKPDQDVQERARLEQIAREKAEQERKQQDEQNKLRYDQLIIDADSAYAQENWENARSLYVEALALFPNEPYPRNQIDLINAILQRTAGEVETVSAITGRFYVVVSSSIDDDLAMDYAKNLAEEGNSVKIIEHKAQGKTFFGVSVADYANWEEALSALNSFNNFGEVWVLKW